MYKDYLALNNLQWLICHKTQPNQILYMDKEDLALNNLQWLICHKTQPNQIIYLIYMYKEDLALNNLQGLICHKIKPNQTETHQVGFEPSSFYCVCGGGRGWGGYAGIKTNTYVTKKNVWSLWHSPFFWVSSVSSDKLSPAK